MLKSSQRTLFSIPEEIDYFNCSYMSPQLNASRDRLLEGVSLKSNPRNWTVSQFFSQAEEIRILCSRLFSGKADNYAVASSASYSLGPAARAVEPSLKKNDQVLLIAEDFPSSVLAWKRVCAETGSGFVILSKAMDWVFSISAIVRSPPYHLRKPG